MAVPRSPLPSQPSKPHPVVVGLLGGVAAGKSAAAAAFAECGATVLDADALAHARLADAEVKGKIRARFGGGVFAADGTVDRGALASRVFSDASARAELEGILHPEIRREIEARLRNATSPLVVLDVPLLAEEGLLAACDVTVFVEADPRYRRARAAAGRGWSTAEVDRREAAQASLDEKRARADYVVDNNGTLEELRERIRSIFAKIAPSSRLAPGAGGRGAR